MTPRLAIFLLLTLLCSCHFFGPRDLDRIKNISDKNQLDNLPGLWKAKQSTYKMLKAKKYQIDSIQLTLKSDSTFLALNLPDCINKPSGDTRTRLLLNASGHWTIYKFGDTWKMQMTFDKNKMLDKNAYLDFDILFLDKKLMLSHFIGDPDQADLLEFERWQN